MIPESIPILESESCITVVYTLPKKSPGTLAAEPFVCQSIHCKRTVHQGMREVCERYSIFILKDKFWSKSSLIGTSWHSRLIVIATPARNT